MSDFTITGTSSRMESLQLDEEDQDRVAGLEEEILSVDQQIQSLQKLKRDLERQKQSIYQSATACSSSKEVTFGRNIQKKKGTNYTDKDFPWTQELDLKKKEIFNISKFRFCQEAVCNAAIDSRHCVVIMPTGAGKSLCYQLPAILSVGLTLVVSPLIALMSDQSFHLKENGIDCELLSSALSKDQSNEVMRRLKIIGTGNGKDGAEDEVRILFVTPERVAKSKTLISILQKIYDRGHLARVVIDEAHCVSAMGHDFRPDYKKLSLLRKLMPETPFMLLTATCGPKVLQDMLSILSLPATTDPTNASNKRTVYFTSPLDRPNLIYSVLSRPTSSKDSTKMISDWILNHHPNETGIVYCLSRKDTQSMSDSLTEISEGKIKTGVYHADLDDSLKQSVHKNWRNGKIKVVCATIAFGLGIDKGDVRFVLHSTCSKSLDGFYQETGRAGRDGKDSDCVLFYRATDFNRLSGMVASETNGIEKLNEMLNYSQSSQCRKILFNQHFNESSVVSSDEKDLNNECGRCDNCITRKKKEDKDITFEVWALVKIVEECYQNEGRVTLTALAELARGNGGGKYNVSSEGGGGGKRKREVSTSGKSGVFDIEEIGGAVDLSKDNVERAIVAAQIAGYIGNDYQATAYTVNVYMKPGPKSLRLSRLNLEEAKRVKDLVYLNIIGNEKVTKSKKNSESLKKKISNTLGSGETSTSSISKSKDQKSKGKGKSVIGSDTQMDDWSDDDDDDDEEENQGQDLVEEFGQNFHEDEYIEEEEEMNLPVKKKQSKITTSTSRSNFIEDEDEDELDEWQVLGGRKGSTSSVSKQKSFGNGNKFAGNPNAPIEIDSD